MRRNMRGDSIKKRIAKIVKTKYFKAVFVIGVWLCFTKFNGIFYQEKLPPADLSYVVVHLDFKKTPLRLDYLQSLLKTLKDHGANGLLMEYEDMFPFDGKLANLSAQNCYKKHELRIFLSEAKLLGFEIIPLVQTFGHMEYVLKLEEFKHLREDPTQTDSICPSKTLSLALIMDMLTQVIKFHSRIAPLKYIHIGCDEVYRMASCSDCIKQNLTVQGIYLRHVNSVHDMVKSLSKGTTVLLWDDMLRTISPKKWKYDYNVPLEPVYWAYHPNFNIRHSSMLNYHKTFSNIWVATAFKGADGPSSVLPNVRNRFINHYTWLSIVTNYKFGGEKQKYKFKGIILTGWSRYNHNKPSCDLLPGSIPSLILNLLLIQEFKTGKIDRLHMNPHLLYKKHIEAKFKDALECRDAEVDFSITHNEVDRLFLNSCNFEEMIFYETLKAYLNLNISITNGIHISTPHKSFSKQEWCEYMMNLVKYLNNDMTENMKDYYKESFVTTYVFDKMFYLKMGLKYCFI